MATNYDLHNTGQEVQQNIDNVPIEAARAQAAEANLQAQINMCYTKDQVYTKEESYNRTEIDEKEIDLQTQINDRYTKSETYTKEEVYDKSEVDSLITTPDVKYITVSRFEDLPEIGETDAVYRVSNWDGEHVVSNAYTEYSWDGTDYKILAVRSDYGIDEIPINGSENVVKSGGIVSAIQEKSPVLSFIGNDNELVYGNLYKGLIAGHTYRFYVKNKNWSMDNVTVGSGYNKFNIALYNNPNRYSTGDNIYISAIGAGVLKNQNVSDSYEFTIPERVNDIDTPEWWCCISGRADSGTVVEVVVEDISSEYNCINAVEIADQIVSDKYIRYSDGNNTTAGTSGNCKEYVFDIANLKTTINGLIDTSKFSVKSIKAYLGWDGTTPAAISFFSETISTSTYIKSASVQAIDSRLGWYEAKIPSNAKYAVISNRGATLSNAVILVVCSRFARTEDVTELNERFGDKPLFSRNEEAVSTAIDTGSMLFNNLPVGSQIELNITQLGGNNPVGIVVMKSTSTSSRKDFLINQTGRYYFERDTTTGLRLIKDAEEGNILNFTISKVGDAIISPSSRLMPNYRLVNNMVTPGETINLGNGFNGYNDTQSVIRSDGSWVSYPIRWENGCTIHIDCTDFTNYYVELRRYYSPKFKVIQSTGITGIIYGVNELNITQAGNYSLNRNVYGWSIGLRRQDRASITPSDVAGVITVTRVSGCIYQKPLVESEVTSIVNKVFDDSGLNVNDLSKALELSKTGYAINAFANNPYYYHFAANDFIRDPAASNPNNKAIASQSLEDVEFAARLGFKFIEANIHPTSDGKFICIHGSQNKFGTEVKSIDSSVITTSTLQNTLIADVTLDFIKTNVRYNSSYTKYQTQIPSLEEFCACCKTHNIGIFAGTNNADAVKICQKYLGNNVIIYNPPSNVRNYYNGYVFFWNNSTSSTPSSLLTTARNYGAPCMCGIGPDLITKFLNDDLMDNFIKSMHDEGFLVGDASVYGTEATHNLLVEKGIDFSGSGHQVNPFDANYEVFDADMGGCLPTTTGSITGGVITLAIGQKVTCGSSTKIIGKGCLTIRFSGTITVSFGSMGNTDRTFESDGSKMIVLSDYFFKRATSFTLIANADTEITHFNYKTSRC